MSDPIPSLAEIRDRASMRCLNPSPAMTDAIADRQALLAAVEGVLGVHRPVTLIDGTTACCTCATVFRAGHDAFVLSETWPCPTVRAITAHVRIEEEMDRG